jgi:Flp pilus assembly protein TadG
VRGTRGATAVEFALTLPVVAYLALAGVEYGWFLYLRAEAVQAAREGCRYAATVELSHSPPPASLADTRTREALTEYGFNEDDVTVSTAYSDLTGDAAGTNDTLTVNVSVVYRPLAGGLVPAPSGMAVSMAMMLQDSK